MSNDTMITLQGWIGSDPTTREVGGAAVTNFRLACTPRRFHRQREEWVDGETQWYTVNAWRLLAENSQRSLQKGDPIVVHGRLAHRTYVNKSGVEVLTLEVEAVTMGHDLSRGCSQFLKAPARQQDTSSTAFVEGPQREATGNPTEPTAQERERAA